MNFNKIDVDQVFGEFAQIMHDGGHLEKKANYSLPGFVVGNNDYTEVETIDTLKRIAEEKLYELSSEDVLGRAHPEGDVKIVDAPDGLGDVETLESEHAKIEEVATKKVTLAKKVIALINHLDKDGFETMTSDLDSKLAAYLGHELPAKLADSEDASAMVVRIGDLVSGAFTESNMLTDHYRDSLLSELSVLTSQPSASGLKEFPNKYYAALKHMWGQPEGRSVAQNLYNVYEDVVSMCKEGVNQMSVVREEDMNGMSMVGDEPLITHEPATHYSEETYSKEV